MFNILQVWVNVDWICSTVNGGTDCVSLLFTLCKMTASNRNCSDWCSHFTVLLNERHTRSISGQWETVECFRVDMPTCMRCQVSAQTDPLQLWAFILRILVIFVFFHLFVFFPPHLFCVFLSLVRTHGAHKLCACWKTHTLSHAETNQQCGMNWTHL